jgi:hypothetical protein
MDYAKDMRIDENALDIEWLEQADLALKYGRHWADCRKRLTLAEEKLKVVKAELIAEANSDPKHCCGKDKPNANDIDAYVRNNLQHKEAKEEWVEAQYELNMAEVAKNEVSFTRKAALENLVILHGQQYFAGPKNKRNLTQERSIREEKAAARDARIADRLTRRSK